MPGDYIGAVNLTLSTALPFRQGLPPIGDLFRDPTQTTVIRGLGGGAARFHTSGWTTLPA